MSKATDEAVDKAIANKMNHYLYRFFKMTTTVCVTATLAVSGLLTMLGEYLYSNSEATRAAIDTFIEVKKRNDDI